MIDATKYENTGLIQFARTSLRQLFEPHTLVVEEYDFGAAAERLNVTFRVQGVIRGSMSGHGETLRDQVVDAVTRSAQDTRFSGALVAADLEVVTVEVWLQTGSYSLEASVREDDSSLIMGAFGVEVEFGSKFAYFKPSVALTSEFASSSELLSALCAKAKLPRDFWKHSECAVRRTTWVHLAETVSKDINVLLSLRKHSSEFEFSPAHIRQWLSECVMYMVRNQESSGDVCYKYHPFRNESLGRRGNPVRSSGCAYALAIASSERDLELGQPISLNAERAVNNILKRKLRTPDGVAFINDESSTKVVGGKLGTTALLLLALLTPALQAHYESDISALANGLLGLQQNDGHFCCTYGSLPETASQSNFFPGQALLACVILASMGQSSFKRGYERAFPFYRDHFRRSPTTAFVGWQVDVWTRAALLSSNKEYASFAFEQTDWLLELQFIQPGDLRNGSFTKRDKNPNYSTVVYCEAIARAADLAYVLGDHLRYTKYREAFHAGLTFASLLRLSAVQGAFFPSPIRAYGGMVMSLTNFTVRADVVQHTITLLSFVLARPHLLNNA